MYIFELIIRYIKGKKYKKLTPDYSPDKSEDIVEKPENCEHFFMPLDSSGEYFACKNCGLVVQKSELKN